VAVSAVIRPAQTARAFDAVAAGYHRSNAENHILKGMRERSLSMLQRYVAAGSHVIDLGCGPGTDHAAMVRAGYTVTAVDFSPGMVRVARTRAAAAGQEAIVTVLQLPIEQVQSLGAARFDAAFSNFGALNCIPDLAQAARAVHGIVKPGGFLVASVIGRLCPWELGLYVWRGDPARALVRWRSGMVAVPLRDGTVWTQYLTPRRVIDVFGDAGFQHEKVRGLGLVVPPPYMEGFAARHPMLLSRLFAIEDRIGGWPLIRAAGDHFLVVMRRG
jgi:SAM-dependent methyltransferase